MSTLNVDFAKHIGKIKPMHAVNNGPVCSRKRYIFKGKIPVA